MIRGREVTLRHVTKRFGEVVALRDLSLSIEAGSFVALLGASAAGKTTMLRVLAGFEMPDSGTVLIGDRDVTHVPPHRRNIGFVFQNFALFPHMTVLDNVTYPLRVRRASRDQQLEKARAVLELVELTGLENRRPHQLSGGQQQRVGLARALVYEPSVLLLDEPLGSLDRKLRDQMQEELRHLHRRVGSTFVLVTHDQEEALALADTVGVLRDGALEQLGSPEEIYTRPASPFVASFIGEMNLLPTQILDVSDERAIGLVAQQRIVLPRPEGTWERAVLAIRPESLRFTAVATNLLRGRISSQIYRGAWIRYTVALPDSLELVVSCEPAAKPGGPGDIVTVGWEPQQARLLPAADPGQEALGSDGIV